LKGRAAGLALLAGLQLLAGLGIRNEALSARARAEIQRRQTRTTLARLQEHRAFLASLVAPAAVAARLERERRLRSLWRPEL